MDGALLMSAKRELNQAQWERIAPLLPGKAGDPGARPRTIACSSGPSKIGRDRPPR